MGTIRELKIIGLDYELSAYVDQEDYRTLDLGSYNWSRLIGHTTTYAKTYKSHKTVLLHRLIMGLENAPKSVIVDHIDGNGLNNYRTNLRITDNRGNRLNSRKSLSDKYTSTYKGVYLDSKNKTNPWRVRAVLSGKDKHIGYYKTEQEAAIAYNQFALENYGTMAYLNIITL